MGANTTTGPRVFYGCRGPGGRTEVWVRSPGGAVHKLPRTNFTPYDWGKGFGTGHAMLARALLAECATSSEIVDRVDAAFIAEVTSRFDRNVWAISEHEIRSWILTQFAATMFPPLEEAKP